MNKVIVIVSIGIVLALIAYVIIGSKMKSSPKPSATQKETPSVTPAQQAPVSYKAGFAIFTHGTFRVFTKAMYHNLSPDVYIESANPNIVHVKKADITWDDFFKTLPMKLSDNCLTTGTGQTFCTNDTQTLQFYINGQLDPSALRREINDGDQLLVSYGSKNEGEIENQLQQIPNVK